MILLALGKGCTDSVLGRKHFDAQENGLGRVGALYYGSCDDVRDQILRWRKADMDLGKRLDALPAE